MRKSKSAILGLVGCLFYVIKNKNLMLNYIAGKKNFLPLQRPIEI